MSEDILDLGGRVALVTGAGQGIGQQIALHLAGHGSDAAAQFRQNYWLINGRSFPDTLLPGPVTKSNATTIQPVAVVAPVGPPDGFLPGSLNYANYGTIYEIPQFGSATTPPKILIRYIDISYVSSPMHFHGWHFKVVGIDGNPVLTTAQKDEFTINGASGKTYDMIITAAARDSVNLAGSQYGLQSPPLNAGQVFDTPAKEFFLLPTGFPQFYNFNGLSVPGNIPTMPVGTILGQGLVDPGATMANGVPVPRTGIVNVSGPTMLPAGAAVQMQLVANLVKSIAPTLNDWTCTPDPILAPPLVVPPPGVCGWATGPVEAGGLAGNLNPFPIPNAIGHLWYPTHDHKLQGDQQRAVPGRRDRPPLGAPGPRDPAVAVTEKTAGVTV